MELQPRTVRPPMQRGLPSTTLQFCISMATLAQQRPRCEPSGALRIPVYTCRAIHRYRRRIWMVVVGSALIGVAVRSVGRPSARTRLITGKQGGEQRALYW